MVMSNSSADEEEINLLEGKKRLDEIHPEEWGFPFEPMDDELDASHQRQAPRKSCRAPSSGTGLSRPPSVK
jgi:hypothetical protein